jgi:hypothetical protein
VDLLNLVDREDIRHISRQLYRFCSARVRQRKGLSREGLNNNTFSEMAMSMRVEDRLQGAQNYPIWKERMTMVLEVNEVLEHTLETATAPTDATQLAIWKKGEAKAKSSILDGIKDHMVSHLSRKTTAKYMWKASSDLYQNKNENMVMALRKQLHGSKMAKDEGVIPYLTKITQIIDVLAVVGEKTEDSELVRIALDGFSKSWDVFVRGVVAREKLLEWQHLWDDLLQEEIRLGQSRSSSSPLVDEEGLALVSKGKGKKKKGGKKKNIDFSKVKCFSVARWDTLPHSV